METNQRFRSDAQEPGFLQRARKTLRALPGPNPHVLLACSAGKDSVALAWTLAELRRLGLLTFSLAHIHHGQHHLADIAAEAVNTIGRQLEVPVTIVTLEAHQIAAHTGLGLEEALRRERYIALAGVAAKTNADCLAVAHHQSDQAETMLLHLMRGSGVDGLAGMATWEIRNIPWWNQENQMFIGIWRPLLAESVEEIAAIAASSGLPIVEDPTNSDTAFRRNAVRHEVLPVLEHISPGSTAAIARAAGLIAGDAGLLTDITNQHLVSCLEQDGLSRKRLTERPAALQRRVVRAWLLQSAFTADISLERIDAIIGIANRNYGGAIVEMGQGYRVVLRNGVLLLDSWQNSGE